MNKKRVIIKIKGTVQDVCFRINTQKQAQQLNLVGWVKNDAAGTVTITAAGEESKLQELIKWCQDGPKYAKVTKVVVEWQPFQNKFQDFLIKY